MQENLESKKQVFFLSHQNKAPWERKTTSWGKKRTLQSKEEGQGVKFHGGVTESKINQVQAKEAKYESLANTQRKRGDYISSPSIAVIRNSIKTI